VELSLHNRPQEIPRVHQALDELAARNGVTRSAIARLQLALEEHLTNVICHGYKAGQTGTITVRITLGPQAIRTEVEDDAAPFNPLDAPDVDTSLPLDQRPIGGLGVLMIRKSVDELDYRRAGGRNVLVLKMLLAEGK